MSALSTFLGPKTSCSPRVTRLIVRGWHHQDFLRPCSLERVNSLRELSRRPASTRVFDLNVCTVHATKRGRPGGGSYAARSAPTAAAVVSPGLVAQRIFIATRI